MLDLAQESRLTAALIDKLHIAVSSQSQTVESLSGGNQQKSVIARWMIEDADLYIFDEPTKGVDVGAKEEIYKLMVEFARRGKCVVMISSEMPELLGVADRILVMYQGAICGECDPRSVGEEEIAALSCMGRAAADTEVSA